MNRRNQREKSVLCIYAYLCLARDINTIIEDTFACPIADIDPYFINVIKKAVTNFNEYKKYIDRVLDNWSFERLGTIEKAILLVGCAEFSLQEVAAAIIIDEAVELAKKYGEADSYRLINNVLDVI